MLQSAAVCCRVMQRVAACCSALQRFTVCCIALQCVTAGAEMCGGGLEWVAVCCICHSMSQRVALSSREGQVPLIYTPETIFRKLVSFVSGSLLEVSFDVYRSLLECFLKCSF